MVVFSHRIYIKCSSFRATPFVYGVRPYIQLLAPTSGVGHNRPFSPSAKSISTWSLRRVGGVFIQPFVVNNNFQ